MTAFDSILRGGDVLAAGNLTRADVAIRDGVIVELAAEIPGPTRAEIDARGLTVLPGVVDMHVHFNEPGRTEWEGWATGSAACAVGGTTTVAEMPLNAHPPTLDGPSFDAKRSAAEASSIVDFALWGGLTPINLDRMEELAERGVIGFKAFMANSGIDDFPSANEKTLHQGMRHAAALRLPVAVHAEDEALTARLAARAVAEGRVGIRDYLASRPIEAEVQAIALALSLAAETGCALHVVHVSSGRGIADIATARAAGVDVSAESCPHYLLFTADDLERLGAIAKCAPPLRSSAEVEALWQHLEHGDIQILASDHSPSPPGMKTGDDFFAIWGGISGCQSLLTSVVSEGGQRQALPLPALVETMTTAPAQRLRLPGKGRIAPGADADLVLVDLAARGTLEAADLRYRHRQSPFVGRAFAGKPVRTILRGETIALNGMPVGAPRGQLLRPGSPPA